NQRLGLGPQPGQVGGPVAEGPAGAAAGGVGLVLGEGAALADPLGGEPQVVAGGHRGAVVAPAWPGGRRGGAGGVEEHVLAEAVLGADALAGDVHGPDVAPTDLGIT